MRPRDAANKVAEVTRALWVAKVAATTPGETLGDLFAQTLGLGYVAGLAVTAAPLVAVLVAQVASPVYRSPLFWAAVVATTTAGTEGSDVMDRTLDLGCVAGSAILFAGLAVTLLAWYARKRSLASSRSPSATPRSCSGSRSSSPTARHGLRRRARRRGRPVLRAGRPRLIGRPSSSCCRTP